MEGRTIARPNRPPAASSSGRHCAFNGGPDNCPAKLVGDDRHRLHLVPSMEGRTIARPNRSASSAYKLQLAGLQWRAGQLPGQTSRAARKRRRKVRLQWRAGQLPGQTHHHRGRPDLAGVPSMEGRTIARPNSHARFRAVTSKRVLQWRAGQLPGQTRKAGQARRVANASFNGGPDNCPAKPEHFGDLAPDRLQPSMEGRTIARPNLTDVIRRV